MDNTIYTFYAIQNHEGKFLRRKWQACNNTKWTNDVTRASILPNLHSARTYVYNCVKKHPEDPTPCLVEFHARMVSLIDETDRVRQARAYREHRMDNRAARKANIATVIKPPFYRYHDWKYDGIADTPSRTCTRCGETVYQKSGEPVALSPGPCPGKKHHR